MVVTRVRVVRNQMKLNRWSLMGQYLEAKK